MFRLSHALLRLAQSFLVQDSKSLTQWSVHDLACQKASATTGLFVDDVQSDVFWVNLPTPLDTYNEANMCVCGMGVVGFFLVVSFFFFFSFVRWKYQTLWWKWQVVGFYPHLLVQAEGAVFHIPTPHHPTHTHIPLPPLTSPNLIPTTRLLPLF